MWSSRARAALALRMPGRPRTPKRVRSRRHHRERSQARSRSPRARARDAARAVIAPPAQADGNHSAPDQRVNPPPPKPAAPLAALRSHPPAHPPPVHFLPTTWTAPTTPRQLAAEDMAPPAAPPGPPAQAQPRPPDVEVWLRTLHGQYVSMSLRNHQVIYMEDLLDKDLVRGHRGASLIGMLIALMSRDPSNDMWVRIEGAGRGSDTPTQHFMPRVRTRQSVSSSSSSDESSLVSERRQAKSREVVGVASR